MNTLFCILGFIFILVWFATSFMFTPIYQKNFIDSQYYKNLRNIIVIFCIITILMAILSFTISYLASLVLFLLAMLLGFSAKSCHKTSLSFKNHEERFLELLKTFSSENQKKLLVNMNSVEKKFYLKMLGIEN